MATSVVMPALELAQETGRLVAWRKREGDRVSKGDPLLEVETDKAVVEVEAPADGILAGLRARDGDIVPVGETIAWVVAPGEAPPTEAAPAGTARRPTNQTRAAPSRLAGAPEELAATRAKLSPKARRLAREHGLDIVTLHGSGPQGAIVAADVLAVASSRDQSGGIELETPGPVWRLMADRTTRGWTSVPHFFLVRDLEAGALIETRERLGPGVEAAHTLRPTHTDLLVALVARVLVRHPRMNASWTNEGVRLNRDINVAVAIAVEDGVVAPVIHNADRAGLGEIASRRRALAERAKAGRLHPLDLAGGTFTISNLGMYHIDAFSAVINPPQAAILAVGRIADRVVPVEGRPGVRPMMTVTLSCDHRVVDGARAAAFLNDVAEAVREPERWLP